MELLEVRYPDKAPRFFVDGKRVSRDCWEAITDQAHRYGTLNSFHTVAKPVGNGQFVRRNYSCC